MSNFKPRMFAGIINEKGLDDMPDFSSTFTVDQVVKGRIYMEADPEYIQGNQTGIVIDDNSCCWHYGTEGFNKRFVEVHYINIIGSGKDKWALLSNLRSGTIIHQKNDGITIFQTIEHAYQYAKAVSVGNIELARKIFFAPSGLDAKYIGNRIIWTNRLKRNWDARKVKLLTRIMRDHYFQPQNLHKAHLLLETGFNPLTHKHPTLKLGIWEKEFPRILMAIREELRDKIKLQPDLQPNARTSSYTEEQPTDVC